MGIITYFLGKLIYPILLTSSATYFAFRLGPQLPLAARQAGRFLGMGYNYFKVTIRVNYRVHHKNSFSHLSRAKPAK